MHLCSRDIDDRWRKVWMQLKQYIRTKNSHGKNEVLTMMSDLEIKEFVEEYVDNPNYFKSEK